MRAVSERESGSGRGVLRFGSRKAETKIKMSITDGISSHTVHNICRGVEYVRRPGLADVYIVEQSDKERVLEDIIEWYSYQSHPTHTPSSLRLAL